MKAKETAASSFPQYPCSSRSRRLVIVRAAAYAYVSSYFSMACCSVVSHWRMFIMLPCSQRALILVLEHVGNFGVRLPPGCSRHGVSVHCMCVQILRFYATRWPVLLSCIQLTLVSWYVASMLCCHCWMFCLSDALPLQSYPSKVWVLCQGGRAYLCTAQLMCFYRYIFLHEIGGILSLTLWRCWLHSCRMFILLVEYGLVLSKMWDRVFLFWSGFCMAESWARRLSLCLACKPFPGLCACTRTGRWCASVVAAMSLSLYTNQADSRSQINSLDSWCATRVSKTLEVVYRYALLVSNSDDEVLLTVLRCQLTN